MKLNTLEMYDLVTKLSEVSPKTTQKEQEDASVEFSKIIEDTGVVQDPEFNRVLLFELLTNILAEITTAKDVIVFLNAVNLPDAITLANIMKEHDVFGVFYFFAFQSNQENKWFTRKMIDHIKENK